MSFEGCSEALVAAVAKRAEFLAELLNTVLDDVLGSDEKKSQVFSREQLLELGAALQLGYWEKNGITLHIENGLPSCVDALEKINEQEKLGAAGFPKSSHELLSFRVMCFWIERFSWVSQDEWKTDIIVGKIDEDEDINLLAEFLWQNRDSLYELESDVEPPNAAADFPDA